MKVWWAWVVRRKFELLLFWPLTLFFVDHALSSQLDAWLGCTLHLLAYGVLCFGPVLLALGHDFYKWWRKQ